MVGEKLRMHPAVAEWQCHSDRGRLFEKRHHPVGGLAAGSNMELNSARILAG